MIGLNILTADGQLLMPPKLNRRRALFVLAKIDDILALEQGTNRERDARFVDLGRYLCEVRAGQYWRLDNGCTRRARYRRRSSNVRWRST